MMNNESVIPSYEKANLRHEIVDDEIDEVAVAASNLILEQRALKIKSEQSDAAALNEESCNRHGNAKELRALAKKYEAIRKMKEIALNNMNVGSFDDSRPSQNSISQ